MENLNSLRREVEAISSRPRGEAKKAAILAGSTASPCWGVRKARSTSRAISARTCSTRSVRSKSMYCMTRWRAVPFWAGVRPNSSAANRGRPRRMGRGGRTAASAASSSSARPLSWVAVSLEGSSTSAPWG